MADDFISFGAKLAQHARRRPDAPAVTCGTETLTYGQLHRLSNRLARALAARGVKFADLVTVGLPNSGGFVAACYGIWKLGAALTHDLHLADCHAAHRPTMSQPFGS